MTRNGRARHRSSVQPGACFRQFGLLESLTGGAVARSIHDETDEPRCRLRSLASFIERSTGRRTSGRCWDWELKRERRPGWSSREHFVIWASPPEDRYPSGACADCGARSRTPVPEPEDTRGCVGRACRLGTPSPLAHGLDPLADRNVANLDRSRRRTRCHHGSILLLDGDSGADSPCRALVQVWRGLAAIGHEQPAQLVVAGGCRRTERAADCTIRGSLRLGSR